MEPADGSLPAAGAVAIPASRPGQSIVPVALFGGTLFLSAVLLFSVQPLFTKMVLPHLGGTPAVWSTAMVFFQAVLLAGYAYAHLLVRYAPRGAAPIIHAGVLALALLWLPIGLASGAAPPTEGGQQIWLIALFATSIGLPFFAVSASAPLLQVWFSDTGHAHGSDPYFLYGASNLGSFFTLLAYPVLIEPLLALGDQSRLWAAGYLALFLAIAACSLLARKSRNAALAAPEVGAVAALAPVTWAERARWAGLAFVPSALLIALTAHLSTNIAAVPFLWVLPLATFLLTFVLAFQRSPILPPRAVELLLPASVIVAMLTYAFATPFGGLSGIAINLFAFLIIALAWHNALAARRPPAAQLTEFYLCMSAGGVLGGAFTSLAAPVLFDQVIEYPLLLVLAFLVVPEARKLLRPRLALPGLALLLLGLAALQASGRVEYRDRSFFGVVSTQLSPDGAFRLLGHGTTIHGAERLADLSALGTPGARPEPLAYYVSGSPLAAGIELQQARRSAPLAVGVVGLGTGTLACYSQPGETWRFYEIDPAVISVATDPRRFTFLPACAPQAEIVPGDARLTLAREIGRRFDVLVIDAFSSDAIPVHLLTREALRLYAGRVRPDGIVVLHISNRFLELASVVAANAAAEGLSAARRLDPGAPVGSERPIFASDVVALARDPSQLAPYLEAGWSPLRLRAGVAAWTDDYSNVVGAILRKQGLL